MQNFTEIVTVRGTPLLGLKARKVAKLAMLDMSMAISRKRCKMRPRVGLDLACERILAAFSLRLAKFVFQQQQQQPQQQQQQQQQQ